MGLSEKVAQEHQALVDCLEAITAHSGRSTLELGGRLEEVMTQGMRLRGLMQEVASTVGTTHTSEITGELERRCTAIRSVAVDAPRADFAEACRELASTLEVEIERLVKEDRRRQSEVLTLTTELGALTGTLIAQTGSAISALQFQDPAIQELRRIDSLVLDLRRAIDDGAEAVRWGHRVGDVRVELQTNTPEALASRALTIREDTRRRVEVFERQTREAVSELQRIHSNLRSVTHAQVTKSRRAADVLAPPESASLQRYSVSFGNALSDLEAMMDTGLQVTGHLSRLIELSHDGLDDSYDGRSSIALATDQVSAIADRITAETPAGAPPRFVADSARAELRTTQSVLELLVDNDKRIRELAIRVEDRLEAMRDAFAAFDKPILPGGEADPVPALLVGASQASDRLFDVIVQEFGLDPSTIQPEEGWESALAEESSTVDDGLILL